MADRLLLTTPLNRFQCKGIYPSVRLSVHLSIYPSVHPYAPMYVYLSHLFPGCTSPLVETKPLQSVLIPED